MKQKPVMFIASQGGHWIQLNRLKDAASSHEVIFVSTAPSLGEFVSPDRFYSVIDAAFDQKLRLTLQACQVLWLVLVTRPSAVVTTGASCGFFAVVFAKLLGAKTVWIDSVANVDELSASGRKVRRFADLWLTQWEHLSRPEGPRYYGAVL